MDDHTRFDLVFAMLREMPAKEQQFEASAGSIYPHEASVEEMEEIENLRKIVVEVNDSYPESFTTT